MSHRDRPVSTPAWVIRDHIRPWTDAGYTHAAIGHAAGVSADTISIVMTLRNRSVKAGTARAILTTSHADVHKAALQLGHHVPTIGTTRRLRALALRGWTCADVARGTGVHVAALVRCINAKTTVISADTALAVHEWFAEHWDKDAPTDTRERRGQATRASRRARREGWHPALAWDDIDDPTATPDAGTTDGRAGLAAEDVEWVLRYERHTRSSLEHRLGASWSTIYGALRRAGRTDLLKRLDEDAA